MEEKTVNCRPGQLTLAYRAFGYTTVSICSSNGEKQAKLLLKYNTACSDPHRVFSHCRWQQGRVGMVRMYNY